MCRRGRVRSAPELPADGVLAPLVAYGANFRADLIEEDDSPLLPFAEPEMPLTRGATAVVHGLGDVPPEEEHEYAYECVVPGGDWLPEHRAKFWRVIAKLHDDRHSDSLLNLRADALEAAIPWHLEHEPAEAFRMLGERARVMLYASYGEDKVLPVVEHALEVWRAHRFEPAEERHGLLQLLEVLDRLRQTYDAAWPMTGEVLELAARGLELSEPRSPQIARFFHALGDGLTHGFESVAPSARVEAALAKHLGADPSRTARAREAWNRALALEDGNFYGKVERSRAEERAYAYRRNLAILDLRDGKTASALAVLALPPDGFAYSRSRHARVVMRILRRENVGREGRLEFVAGVLKRNVIEGDFKSEYDFEGGVKELDWALRHFADLGAGLELAPLIAQARSRPGITEAITRLDARRRAADADADAWAGRLAEAMAPKTNEGDGPPEAAEARRRHEREERLANESPPERAERVLREHRDLSRWKAELLFELRATIQEDGLAIAVVLNAFVPEVHLETVWADPATDAFEKSLRESLAAELPGVEVLLEMTSLCLMRAPDDTAALATALSHFGATQTLEALGLKPMPPPADPQSLAKDVARLAQDARFDL